MNTPTPTPRTDYFTKTAYDTDIDDYVAYNKAVAFAQNLERELTAVTEELTAAREVADKYRGYWESFGAERLKLKGEITAVTKQRDEAREELRQVLQRLTQPTKP